ncbi:MAG: hypothetical protein ACP5KF_07455, partial [Sulfurihydrogenibium sp.]
MPYRYKEGFSEKDEKKINFEAVSQEGLRSIMRRVLIKRFESSFGAFEQTIRNFLKFYEKAKNFIEKTGLYVLDKKLLELSQGVEDDDALLSELKKRMGIMENVKIELKDLLKSKDLYVYDLKDFKEKDKFLKDIDKDIELLNDILKEMERLNLLED